MFLIEGRLYAVKDEDRKMKTMKLEVCCVRNKR